MADSDDWNELWAAATRMPSPGDRPRVLVLDDAHRLTEARARFIEPLVRALSRARAAGVAIHVVLAGRESGLPPEDAFGDLTCDTLRVPPLPLRAAAPHLPGSEAYQLIRAYGVFGGLPGVLAVLDPERTVGTNVRRLMLDTDGALADAPLGWLEREVQTPSRYVAILRALARGESDWASIHRGVPDLTRSGQVAPYLKRLGEMGLVEARTSLDASPRSRNTRYALADPFLAFWFRFVFPWRFQPDAREPDASIREHYARMIRPSVDDHLETIMPRIARNHMEHDALESLGATARESGSLWGPDVEIPVAGILTSGAAFYGRCSWSAPERPSDPLSQLDGEIRETRYGFGRERRLRLLFTGRTAPVWLRREAARRPDALLIDAEALVGD